jgi:hypothetical protein
MAGSSLLLALASMFTPGVGTHDHISVCFSNPYGLGHVSCSSMRGGVGLSNLVFIVCILLCVIYRIYDVYNEGSLHNSICEETTK